MNNYDAAIIGSGPNGLVAAITIARTGRRVLVVEGQATAGGGVRSAELTEPGFVHDVCSAIHPLAVASPALRAMPLDRHGLRWIQPAVPLAHPLDDHTVLLERSVEATSANLGVDGKAWTKLFAPPVDGGFGFVDDVLDPLSVPRHPITMARFGLGALRSAASLRRSHFHGEEAAALFAGMAAHALMPLDQRVSAGVGLFLCALGHLAGWPLAATGSQAIVDALVAELLSHGGELECARPISRLDELPPSTVVLADVVPRNLATIAGDRLPDRTRKRYLRFRHGPAVFKVDYALADAVPWKAEECRRAATVHVGASLAEIGGALTAVASGRPPDPPFLVVAQPTLVDHTRAPEGRHVLWAYGHVPRGWHGDLTAAIDDQIERFAPGFRDLVLARSSWGPPELEAHNRSMIDGDIAGGLFQGRQVLFRPVVARVPYATPDPAIFLCSAATPPGPGVHGMAGHLAAKVALRRVFGLTN
jgi:phytoene dehydrogenase-like protein